MVRVLSSHPRDTGSHPGNGRFTSFECIKKKLKYKAYILNYVSMSYIKDGRPNIPNTLSDNFTGSRPNMESLVV